MRLALHSLAQMGHWTARVFPLFYLSGSILDFLISHLMSASIQAHLPCQGGLKVGVQPIQKVSFPGFLCSLCGHGMWEGCSQPHCVANLGIEVLHGFFGALLDGVQLLHQSVLIRHDPKVVVKLSNQLVQGKCPLLEMDTISASLTIKLISLLFLDTKPPNTPDTSMNVWCLGWISKIRSGKSISLVLSKFNFQLQKCWIFNMVTKMHLCLRQ